MTTNAPPNTSNNGRSRVPTKMLPPSREPPLCRHGYSNPPLIFMWRPGYRVLFQQYPILPNTTQSPTITMSLAGITINTSWPRVQRYNMMRAIMGVIVRMRSPLRRDSYRYSKGPILLWIRRGKNRSSCAKGTKLLSKSLMSTARVG
jgi:hypothetical protein